MSFFKGILTDLRQRRLWPVPLALIAAIVAVPVVLAKTPHPPATPPLPSSPGPSAGTPVASITVDTSDQSRHPAGKARDPFTQQVIPTKAASSVAGALSGGSHSASTATVSGGSGLGTGSSGNGSAVAGSTGSSAGSTSSSGTTGGGSTSGSTPASPLPHNAKPTPAPSGLTANEAYRVSLSISNSTGGVSAVDSLVRLSPLPSTSHPLVVELGVLQGGNQVLFAVQPGTTVSGPAKCITGPIDCELISLSQDQVENVSAGSFTASFAITGITAGKYSSAAAASAARQATSVVGRELMTNSSLSALSLFQYQPQVGALVDLRNLTVGGN